MTFWLQFNGSKCGACHSHTAGQAGPSFGWESCWPKMCVSVDLACPGHTVQSHCVVADWCCLSDVGPYLSRLSTSFIIIVITEWTIWQLRSPYGHLFAPPAPSKGRDIRRLAVGIVGERGEPWTEIVQWVENKQSKDLSLPVRQRDAECRTSLSWQYPTCWNEFDVNADIWGLGEQWGRAEGRTLEDWVEERW